MSAVRSIASLLVKLVTTELVSTFDCPSGAPHISIRQFSVVKVEDPLSLTLRAEWTAPD